MPRLVGIHALGLRSGADGQKFEEFMTEKALPTAAEVPGSVNRGGQSAIKSQHLLRSSGDSRTYLWLVKDSGVFSADQFAGVFGRMYEEVREQLEAYGTRESSSIFGVVDSFDAGPRDISGQLTGNPKRGSEI